ncbi:lytic transglycosylase domain-containing protein [Ramlibacter sp. AN1133]|uniref:lytic transglycosylase domain-containing protein n=1 Tax=Ramlibacter sp. AN1133 TaxID=3133429 RepID=UPI0030BE77F5
MSIVGVWCERVAAVALLGVMASVAHGSAAHGSSSAEACIAGAAAFHEVNPTMLAAILRVEGMRERQVTVNSNGTQDVGRAAINSIHFAELGRWGVAPARLMDGCTNTYVAAWLVRKNLLRYGNTWAGYAAYHSRTPARNVRYQLLLANELTRMGVLSGPLQPLPTVK